MADYLAKAMEANTTVVDDVVLQLTGIVIFLAVHGYLLAKNGQTVGKKLLSIRVVSHSTGQILSFGAITTKRILPIWLVAMVPVVGGIIAIVNVLFIFRKDRRCLHDLIADSEVVAIPKS